VYSLNFTPTRVQSRREIMSGGLGTQKGEYHHSRHLHPVSRNGDRSVSVMTR
jgi:hypothetical protein